MGLNYVTERILASVLPHRNYHPHEKIRLHNEISVDNNNNEYNNGNNNTNDLSTPQDIYEKELISMLEQKHGKVIIFCYA